MAGGRKRKDYTFGVNIKFNKGESYMIDQLLATGLYGHNRTAVVRRLVDQGLREKLDTFEFAKKELGKTGGRKG